LNLFYFANIGLAITVVLWPLWFSRVILRLEWLNPFSIILLLSLPVEAMKILGGPVVLLDDGLFDVGYQFGLLMNSLYSVLQALSSALFFKLFCGINAEKFLPWRTLVLSRKTLSRCSWLCFTLFGASFYILSSKDFGVINWVINPREGYQLYRAGSGPWFALAVTFISASYLFSFLANPRPRAIIISTLFHFLAIYLLGSKGFLLALFGASLVFLWFIRWVHLKRLLVFGSPLIFGAMVFNLYLALDDNFGILSIFEYFDFYKNAALYYRGYLDGEIPLFYGDVFLTSFWEYIPRAVWSEKPWAYGISLVNEIFYPGQAELTNTPAFGGAVGQFADFGVFGVLMFGFFNEYSIKLALLSYFIFRRPGIDFSRVTGASAILILIQFAPSFGAFFPGLLFTGATLLVALILGISRLRAISRPAVGNPPAEVRV
jgi:hypothetical protein